MNRSDFDTEFSRLVREFGAGEKNLGSFRSEGCTGSMHCMFCKGCRNCYRCTYCQDCEAITGSGHRIRCVGCHDCSHCEDAPGCTHSPGANRDNQESKIWILRVAFHGIPAQFR